MFPHLQLPLATPQVCALLPSGANPPLPTPADAIVRLEPGHETSKPSSDVDAFSQVEGVEHITLVLDGRMDLCEEYDQYNMSNRDLYPCAGSPDLRQITPEHLDALATEVAKVACESDVVAGVQIDLEPLSKQWRGSAIDAMGRMAKALVESPGCKTDRYPNGRHISTFAFAESVDDTLLNALGSNGYLAISGYDLYPDNVDGRFSAPSEYGDKLRRQVEMVVELAGGTTVDCKVPWVRTWGGRRRRSYRIDEM